MHLDEAKQILKNTGFICEYADNEHEADAKKTIAKVQEIINRAKRHEISYIEAVSKIVYITYHEE